MNNEDHDYHNVSWLIIIKSLSARRIELSDISLKPFLVKVVKRHWLFVCPCCNFLFKKIDKYEIWLFWVIISFKIIVCFFKQSKCGLNLKKFFWKLRCGNSVYDNYILCNPIHCILRCEITFLFFSFVLGILTKRHYISFFKEEKDTKNRKGSTLF